MNETMNRVEAQAAAHVAGHDLGAWLPAPGDPRLLFLVCLRPGCPLHLESQRGDEGCRVVELPARCVPAEGRGR